VSQFPSPSTSPAAGWYHDGTALRWWDGTSWGPYAPTQVMPSAVLDPSASKTWAVLAHLPFLGIVMPVLAYALHGDKDPFVKHHGAEALNWQITMLVVQMIGMAVMFSTFFRTFGSSFNQNSTPFASRSFVTLWLAFAALSLVNIALGVVAMIAASKHKLFRYPVSIRIVKGALPKGTVLPAWPS
jgi:uncharacterized Tic20 family protein